MTRVLAGNRPVKLLVALLAIAAAAGYLVNLRSDDSTGSVEGLFRDASPLEVGSEVRAAGVKVGKVSFIRLEGKVARVGLDVEDAVLPLHQDARMVIRPINLLGENFVELVPGSDSAKLLRGDVPLAQTSNAVTLQGVLDTFDDPTSTGLAALVSELGNGIAGNGAEVGDAIKALGPAMQQIDRLGDVLRSQNSVLNDLVETADPVARAVSGKDGERLDRLVEQTRQTLVALASQQSGIQETLDELPGTLTEARQTLSALDRVAAAATPTLRKARPLTGDLKEISGEIQEFSTYATPAFNSFDGVFAEADRLLREAAPVAADLRSVAPHLRATSRSLRVAGDQLVDQHLGDLMAFVRKWALSTNGRDNVSHYFRGVFHVTPAALNALLGQDVLPEVIAPGGDGTGNGNGLLPDLPGLDLGALDLNGSVGGLLGLVTGQGNAANTQGGILGGLLGGTRTQQRTDANSATGLTSSQEQSLLGQLLGGMS